MSYALTQPRAFDRRPDARLGIVGLSADLLAVERYIYDSSYQTRARVECVGGASAIRDYIRDEAPDLLDAQWDVGDGDYRNRLTLDAAIDLLMEQV